MTERSGRSRPSREVDGTRREARAIVDGRARRRTRSKSVSSSVHEGPIRSWRLDWRGIICVRRPGGRANLARNRRISGRRRATGLRSREDLLD